MGGRPGVHVSDIADLNEVRGALEALTFRLAAQRRHRAGLDRLRSNLQEELKAACAGDGVRARRAAADFHETVTSMAANELLSELESTFRSRMRWLLGQHDDLMAIAREHEALYAAIADRNVALVDELVAKHLENSRHAMVAHHQ
ncbi:GntR family transcriptional regulator [Streptomyces sp. NPDC002545]